MVSVLAEDRAGLFAKIREDYDLLSGDVSKLKVKTRVYKLLNGEEDILVEQVGDGSIIKRFDKTPYPVKDSDVVCPHFLELKWAYGCPYSCAWCFLQGTLRFTGKQPRVKPYEKIYQHLLAFFTFKTSPELLNSGELADSLMFEHSYKPFSKFIISMFQAQDKHKILFLTKSDYVKNMLEIEEHSQAVASFSLNALKVAEKWEKAPPVKNRLNAAEKLSKAGYEVRVRIDPMVPVEDWETEYKQLADLIFNKLTPSRITLGSLRGLQTTINNAADKSWVKYLSATSNWGKKINDNLREKIYSKIINHLEAEYNYTNIALCKETRKTWENLGLNYKKIKCNCTL